MTSAQAGSRHLTELDRFWRSSKARRRFEQRCGFEPLALERTQKDRQDMSGYTARYRDAFFEWARAEYRGTRGHLPDKRAARAAAG